MTIDEKLEEMAKQLNLGGDEAARRFARHFAAWAVREAATRASILDYDRELVDQMLREFADHLQGESV